MKQKTVLAIDPGSSKLGMAVVRRDVSDKLNLDWRAICPREELATTFQSVISDHPVELVIVGNGTKSKEIVAEIRDLSPSMGVLVVDEKDTTMQARERYWEYNPRRGWRRLCPATLQVPPDPVDDFVALILAERVLLQS